MHIKCQIVQVLDRTVRAKLNKTRANKLTQDCQKISERKEVSDARIRWKEGYTTKLIHTDKNGVATYTLYDSQDIPIKGKKISDFENCMFKIKITPFFVRNQIYFRCGKMILVL